MISDMEHSITIRVLPDQGYVLQDPDTGEDKAAFSNWGEVVENLPNYLQQ